MLRKFHSLGGLWGVILIVTMAVTGAILSVSPLNERVATSIPASGTMSVAQLAAKVSEHYPGATQIQRTPNGAIVVYFEDGDTTGADFVALLTGAKLSTFETFPAMRWIKNLHRSFFLNTEGRIATGLGALFMCILCVSGAFMLAQRAGGWRNFFTPVRGTASERLHGILGRAAVMGLFLSSTTGLYLSLTTLGFIPEAQETETIDPDVSAVAGNALPLASLSALQNIDVNDLRELVFPYPGDPLDNYSVLTGQGAGLISPVTGEFATPFQSHNVGYQVYELIYRLHTGEGLWWLGIYLGCSALTVPFLGFTGIQIWWKRRKSKLAMVSNSTVETADTIILVGSETNTTWGFAKTLHDALVQKGFRVHTDSMNRLSRRYDKAKRLIIFAATYGDGGAPVSANRFFGRLDKIKDNFAVPYAVLGFGDRQYPQFCQFATDVDAALEAKGWKRLLALDTIDRQSAQEFSRWGNALAEACGISLELNHQSERPHTQTFQLQERINYGIESAEPAAIFRFTSERGSERSSVHPTRVNASKLPDFEAGDLVGILPPGSDIPRYYSLASSSSEGVMEICVRKHPGGVCSGFLHGLTPGDSIDAFIKPNPHFRPTHGKAPVILIGAGTGIGPLAGFIRNNTPGHPMYLYWGGRNPQSDFLYESDLQRYLHEKRLARLVTAFSRVENKSYVQDEIKRDATEIRKLSQNGAQILVCGGRSMAKSVKDAFDDILAPVNMNVQMLKARGRYREDIY